MNGSGGGGRSRSSSRSHVIDSREAPLTFNPAAGSQQQQHTQRWTTDAATAGRMPPSSYASQHTLKTIRRNDREGSPDDDDDDAGRQWRQRGAAGADQPYSNGDGDSSAAAYAADIKRGNPQFIIDLEPPGRPATRDRSLTFGGMPLPPSPAPPSTFDNNRKDSSTAIRVQPRPSLARQDTDASLNSLRLGGGLDGDSDPNSFSSRRPILTSALKALALFVLSLLLLYVTLHTLLPPIDDEHRDKVKLPKSFDDLKSLNEVLQVYKDRNYARVLGCYVTVYLL